MAGEAITTSPVVFVASNSRAIEAADTPPIVVVLNWAKSLAR